jgi:hypothetical protein
MSIALTRDPVDVDTDIDVAGPVAVSVSVTARGRIVCSPDPVVVSGGQGALRFTLVTPGYVFRDADAIVVSQPGTDFPHPSSTAPGGTEAILWDRDRQRASYAYTVFVQEQATGRMLSVDPTIENEPD